MIYLVVFPNVLLSLHPDYVMTHLLTPLGPGRTRVRCSWWFSPEDVDRSGFDPRYAFGLLGRHQSSGLLGVRVGPTGPRLRALGTGAARTRRRRRLSVRDHGGAGLPGLDGDGRLTSRRARGAATNLPDGLAPLGAGAPWATLVTGRDQLGPVGLVFHAELRRRWKSWLALAGLIGLVGGLVLGAVATGSRTSSSFSRFVAAHGFDAVAFNDGPAPGLARLPEVASEIRARVPTNGQLECACSQKVTSTNFLLASVSARNLPKVVKLLSGRMPDQSKPDEVLASFTLQQLGLHVGSLIRIPTYAPSQKAEALNNTGSPRGPVLTLHVVGIEAAELEFPTGAEPSYDVWGTQALAESTQTRSLMFDAYFVRLRHGARDLPRFNADARSMHVLFSVGESAAADAVKTSIHPQAVGWWVLALLAGLAGLVVVGQAIGRQNVVESEEYPTLATLGLVPRQLVQLGMARNLTVAVAGALGAVILATALSPLTPVGEARQADPSVGVSFDTLVLLLGALAIVVIVFLLGLWPAVRASHLDHGQVSEAALRPSAIATSLGAAGAPPSAVIGIRHALARGRGRATVPVGTALFGTVLAVMALCGTAVFGASLTRLTHTPRALRRPLSVGSHGDHRCRRRAADTHRTPQDLATRSEGDADHARHQPGDRGQRHDDRRLGGDPDPRSRAAVDGRRGLSEERSTRSRSDPPPCARSARTSVPASRCRCRAPAVAPRRHRSGSWQGSRSPETWGVAVSARAAP